LKLTINLEKARQIAHSTRREFRSAEFAPYDEVIAKQIPGQEGAEATRQAIRTKYAALQEQIDAATSVDMLRALLSQNHIDTLHVLTPTTEASGQLITPNPDIACMPGMCLAYVKDAFGVTPKYPTAIAGWEASKRKHSNKDFPSDVWVPVWFSLTNNPNGHVAIRQPDGSIWSASHPTRTTPVHHSSLADIERYYNGRLTYLGWTEDVEDTLVIG
jgi:hypothetical protein